MPESRALKTATVSATRTPATTASAAGPPPSSPAGASKSTTRARFAHGACLVHYQCPAEKIFAVAGLDGAIHVLIRDLDKSEATRIPGYAIAHEIDARHIHFRTGEPILQVVLAGLKGEISNVKPFQSYFSFFLGLETAAASGNLLKRKLSYGGQAFARRHRGSRRSSDNSTSSILPKSPVAVNALFSAFSPH